MCLRSADWVEPMTHWTGFLHFKQEGTAPPAPTSPTNTHTHVHLRGDHDAGRLNHNNPAFFLLSLLKLAFLLPCIKDLSDTPLNFMHFIEAGFYHVLHKTLLFTIYSF